MSKVGVEVRGSGATVGFRMAATLWRRFSVPAALLAVVTTSAGACTDEFDSCKETRTCMPEAMDGGAAGSPLSDGGETGVVGAAGGVQLAGEGGASSVAEPFSVVSTAPEADATGVERDESIRVTFSAPVDPDTVSGDSFRLIGPDGPVAGKLEVSGAEVVLTPATDLSLYASYEIELSADLASTDSQVLQEGQRFGFTTRDGAWGQPKRLTSADVANVAAVGARNGHVVVDWHDGGSPSSKIVTFFDPVSGTWSTPGPIETRTDFNYAGGCVVLNDKGETFSVLGSDPNAVWNRGKQGVWGIAKPTLAAHHGSCALADDGTAMAVWENLVGDHTVWASSLSAQDVWSEPKALKSQARSNGVIRYGSGFLAVQRLDGGGTVATEYDPQLGWLPSKPMVEPGVDASYWSLAASSPAALMTWTGPGERVHVSSFNGQSWTSHELGPGHYGTMASMSSAGRLAAWVNGDFAYVVRGDVDGRWQDPVKLGAATANMVGDFGPAATIDSSGNALAAVPNGNVIAWRRSLHGSPEWSEVEEIVDQDPNLVVSKVDSSGNVMLIWQNPLGVWASRFE
jgi:hypothetical protein